MIVVTAPTARIGRQVVTGLLDAGQAVRVVARDPGKLPERVREQAEVVEGTHGDPAVVDRAFEGADTVFWLCPADPAAQDVVAAFVEFSRPAAQSFTRHGVQRVVGISALGRGTPYAGKAGLVTGSLAMDDLIAASGVAYRAMALPGFMDNLLREAGSIRNRGVFTGTQPGDWRHPTCATRDIAAASVRLLLDGAWTGYAEQPVLGPEDLTLDEQAAVMTEVLGRPVRYERVTADAVKAGLTSYAGWSEPMAQAMADMMDAKEAGLDAGAVRTAETASPTTFRTWCAEELAPAVA